MKYSLKNKEFSRKKHSIFDNTPRRSRSKTTSPKAKKQSPNPKESIKMHYTVNIIQPSLNQTAVNKLNALDSQSNSLNHKTQEQELPMFQSFSRVEPVNLSSKLPFNQASETQNINAIKPSEPIKFVIPSKVSHDTKIKHSPEFSEPRSESFQVCEDENPSRVNRFFAESIMAKESESPMNKVVFEPVIRKSLSPDPKSLSPDLKVNQHALNRVTPINLKIEPQTRVIFHQPIQSQLVSQPLVQRKVSIVQIPRQPIKIQPQRIVHPNVMGLNPSGDPVVINKFQADEVSELKKRVEQQDLQIQYLKNQKQILQSNIQLKFSPKKVSYHQNQQPYPKTPEKHKTQIQTYHSINQEIDRSKLFELADILKHNQAKIMFLEGKCRSFYSQIYQRFNQSLEKCQETLIKLFSQKYQCFTEELNAKMHLIDQKSTYVQKIDHKLDVFNNTFRSIEENLRLTKLKLQNIELLIENKYKKSDRFWNKEGDSRLMMENPSDISSIRIFNDNQLEEKDREELKRLQRNLNKKSCNSQWTEHRYDDPIQFDSFLDEKYSHLVYNPKKESSDPKQKEEVYSNEAYRKSQHFKNKQKSQPKNSFVVSQIYESTEKKLQTNNRSTIEEIEQFSPFQANQMFRNQQKNGSSTNGTFLKNSETVQNNDFTSSNAKRNSLNNRNQRNRTHLSFDDASSKHFDFSQNSFQVQMDYKETPRNLLEKEISFTSQNMFKKNPSKQIPENEDISDTLQGEQERLINILQAKNYKFPIQCWLDEMGCLRKKNQTYIFDDQGSVIMTTAAAYKKLKEKRYLA